MDIYDQATEQEEFARESALAIARKESIKLKPSGYCYNCEELINNKLNLFCDADCRDDWQRRQRNK